jgi:hypothetical protein
MALATRCQRQLVLNSGQVVTASKTSWEALSTLKQKQWAGYFAKNGFKNNSKNAIRFIILGCLLIDVF